MTLGSIHTQRLLLRRWREQDRAAFAALNADPRVMEHFPALLTRQESDALLDRIEAGCRPTCRGRLRPQLAARSLA